MRSGEVAHEMVLPEMARRAVKLKTVNHQPGEAANNDVVIHNETTNCATANGEAMKRRKRQLTNFDRNETRY